MYYISRLDISDSMWLLVRAQTKYKNSNIPYHFSVIPNFTDKVYNEIIMLATVGKEIEL